MESDILKTEVLLELIYSTELKDSEEEVINSTLPVYLRKLNCFMAVVLKKSCSHLLEKQILPYSYKKNESWQQVKIQVFDLIWDEKSGSKELIQNDNYYYIYSLHEYGYLVLGRKKQFDFIFKNEFVFVANYLGKILYQSIEIKRRRGIDKRIANERRLLKTIIDNIPINIYTKDLQYRKTLVNANELKSLNASNEKDVLGKTDLQLYGESVAKSTLLEDQQVMVAGIPILGEEKRVGKDRWALISKLPLKNEDGTITGMVGISIDYTDRKKTHEKLSIFIDLFDNLSDAVQISLESGQLFYVNKAASERLSILPSEVQNYNVRDFEAIFPTQETWINHVNEVKKKDYLTINGLNINQATGAEIPVEVTVKYISVEGKGFIAAISRDISERMIADKALRESEEQKSSLIASMSDFVFVFDNNLILKECHIPTGTDLFFDPQKYVEQSFDNIALPEPSKVIIKKALIECLQNLSFVKNEFYFDVPNSRFWFELHTTILKGIDGNQNGVTLVLRDITERKKTEESLLYNESLLNSFFNLSPVGIALNDFETGQFINVNQAMLIPTGYSREELLTKSFLDLTPIENREEEIKRVKGFNKLGNFGPVEKEYQRKDGSRYFVMLRGTVVEDSFSKKMFWTVVEDITERKKVELALRNSEERKASLIASMSDIVYVLDNNLVLNEYHMPEGIDFIIDPESYLEKPFDDIPLPQPAKGIIKDALVYCVKNHTSKKADYYLDTFKGRTWHELHATVLRGQNGQQSGVTCIIRDITYRQQREDLILQQTKLKDILINISSVYINIDLNKVEETIQKSLKELAEFVNADRAYIFDYDFNENTASNTYEWCEKGILPKIIEYQKVPLDSMPNLLKKHRIGKKFYVANTSELSNDNYSEVREILEQHGIKSLISIPMVSFGKLTGFIGFDSIRTQHSYSEKEIKLLEVYSQMLVNVRERKRAETLLKLQEEKYRNIISNMNLGIIEVDPHENIMYANQSFCTISGYSLNELLSMKATSFLFSDNDEKLLKDKFQKRTKGISDGYELSVKNKKGEPRWWFVSGAPNYNDKGELVGSIGIHLDITKQKKLENELEKAIFIAEEAAKAKEVFLANMSHEIRTPLNVIIGMMRELGKDNLTNKQLKYLSHSETAAQHLLTIINNILDMSKIEAGEFQLENKDFSVSAVISDVRSILYSRAKEKNIEIITQLSNDVKRTLIGDAGRLRQILINLVGNSLKFTEKGHIEIKVSLTNGNRYFQRLLFEVKDTGIGMSNEFLYKLFDKFSQEEGSANRKYEGTGLGMTITKELVLLMGGNIEAKSQKGVGTQIAFELNLPIGDEAKLTSKSDKIEQNSLAGFKILLAEDNEMNRFIAIQSLNYLGCQVVEASNGLEALELLKTREFDLILMDIQMPEMDGIDATKIIRNELKKSVPIIALTANAFKHDIDLYLSVGMNDYIIKPYNENEFFTKIQKFAHEFISKPDLSIAEESTTLLYNLTQLKELSRGDKSFINSMLDIFQTTTSEAIIQFRTDFTNNEFENIRKLAHKIKPSIDNMGIDTIKEKIRQLEKYGLDENNSFDLKELIETVCSTLELVNEQIKKHEKQ